MIVASITTRSPSSSFSHVIVYGSPVARLGASTRPHQPHELGRVGERRPDAFDGMREPAPVAQDDVVAALLHRAEIAHGASFVACVSRWRSSASSRPAQWWRYGASQASSSASGSGRSA